MSLLVGELKAAVEHLSANFKLRDHEAVKHREDLHRKIDGLQNQTQRMEGTVESVQQDVAEMKNDLSDAREKVEKIEQQKPIFMAAVGNVDELMKFKATLQLQEQRALGWWDAAKGVSRVTWFFISVAAVGGFVIFKDYILPRLL